MPPLAGWSLLASGVLAAAVLVAFATAATAA